MIMLYGYFGIYFICVRKAKKKAFNPEERGEYRIEEGVRRSPLVHDKLAL